MKITMTVEKEVEVKTLRVVAGVRYWCDATVNGVDGEDDDGAADPGIPLRNGDSWCIDIDIETGVIQNWPQGTTASVHYKVCDAGVYSVLDSEGNTVAEKDGYVPSMLSPGGSGYGDYIIMDIDATGKIDKWNFDDTYFSEE